MGSRFANTKLFFACWILLLPTGLYFSYHFYPSQPISLPMLICFLALTGIVSYFPVIINEVPLFLVQWVTLAGFLMYGLYFEMILMQFSVIVLMIPLKVRKDNIYRYFINSVMFVIISLLSGMAFHDVGGEIGSNRILGLIFPIIIYSLVDFWINQVMVHGLSLLMGRKKRFFSRDVFWEILIISMVIPLGIGLYFLIQSIGYAAFLIIGIPLVSFLLVIRLYNSSEKINDYLQRAAEIGHQLTGQLQVNELFDLFIDKISQTLTVDFAYILDVREDKLVLLRGVEKGAQKPNIIPPIEINEGIAGRVWATKKAEIFHERSDWIDDIRGYVPAGAESILCVPIFKNKKVEGVLFLASTRKKQYEKYQISIMEILCSYFVVALSNARHYEKTKMNSEHCPMTKLYNYRYFDELLATEFQLLEKGERKELSLIMLDIDYFKKINDTYGHQSGNEILIQMARRLRSLVGNRGTLARYGGEEFVILLPDTNKQAALRLAELVRLTIANRTFGIQNFLDIDSKHESVQVTASIGVATAPYDAEDAMALVRHADRALYIGAKRAGKNRVAEYVK